MDQKLIQEIGESLGAIAALKGENARLKDEVAFLRSLLVDHFKKPDGQEKGS